jgi:hypothetical protein
MKRNITYHDIIYRNENKKYFVPIIKRKTASSDFTKKKKKTINMAYFHSDYY